MAEGPRFIEVEGQRLGILLNKPGESFALRHLFSRESLPYLDNDKIVQAYFRTDSENIYLLDEQGLLMNRITNIQRGRIAPVRLSLAVFMNESLIVGEPFDYKIGNTTPLTEIIPVTRTSHFQDTLKDRTLSRRSSIIEEFMHGFPRARIG